MKQEWFGRGFAPRGRFTNLTEKIKFNVTFFLYEKIKRLYEEKLISRYRYFKNAQEKFHNRFEKMYNNTHKELHKKNTEINEYKEKDNDYKLDKSKRKTKSRFKKLEFNLNNNYNLSF